jgi:small nuclear ribonucleoprotein (snRNP)-like protein
MSTTSLTDPFLVTGVLKGYDQLLNLVLDEVVETIQGMQPGWTIAQILISFPMQNPNHILAILDWLSSVVPQ